MKLGLVANYPSVARQALTKSETADAYSRTIEANIQTRKNWIEKNKKSHSEQVKEYHQEVLNRPGMRAKQNKIARERWNNRSPEEKVKTAQKRKEYSERPDVKEKLIEYRKEYNNRPEVKKRKHELICETALEGL